MHSRNENQLERRTVATDDAVHEVRVDDLAVALALQQIQDCAGETFLERRKHLLSPGDQRQLSNNRNSAPSEYSME